jgi:hypothetical protein
LLIDALASVTGGTTTSAVAYVASKHQKLDRNSALASFLRTIVQIALG